MVLSALSKNHLCSRIHCRGYTVLLALCRLLLDDEAKVFVSLCHYVPGWRQCAGRQPATDRDGRAGDEETGVHHGGHQQARYDMVGTA